jgi:hypothetical protein
VTVPVLSVVVVVVSGAPLVPVATVVELFHLDLPQDRLSRSRLQGKWI